MTETSEKKSLPPMRKVILGVVIAMAVAFVVFSITEIQSVLEAVRSGNLAFLLLAIALEVACLINNSANYRTLYRLVGLENPCASCS